MDSRTASDLFRVAVNGVEELMQQRERGSLRTDTHQNVLSSIQRLSAVTDRFMDGLHAVAESAADDLMTENSEARVTEHIAAYNGCEEAVNLLATRQTNVMSAFLAMASADAVYVSVFENKPLQPIDRDRDLDIATPTFSEAMNIDVLFPVSAARANHRGRRRREVKPVTPPPPHSACPQENLAQLTAGAEPTSAEIDGFVERILTRLRTRGKTVQSTEALVKQILLSDAHAQVGSWTACVRSSLADPTTSILDGVAAVSATLASSHSMTNTMIHNAAWSNIVHRIAASLNSAGLAGSSIERSLRPAGALTQLFMSGKSILSVAVELSIQGLAGYSSVAGFVSANVVELLYGFVTLFLPARTGLHSFQLLRVLPDVPEQELPAAMKKSWYQQLHYWAPFISLATAVALLIARPAISSYIITSAPDIMRSDRAAILPGGLATALARLYLPAPVASTLDNFYKFAANKVDAFHEAVPEDVPSGILDWIVKFVSLVSRLHRLRFAAPLLHVFSLADIAIHELAVLWRWTAVGLQRVLGSRDGVYRLTDLALDWMVSLVDLVLLLLQIGVRTLRYRSVVLLMYPFISALVLGGMTSVSSVLEADPRFEVFWTSR